MDWWPPANVPSGFVWVVQGAPLAGETWGPADHVFTRPELISEAYDIVRWEVLCDHGECFAATLADGTGIHVYGLPLTDAVPYRPVDDRTEAIAAWIREGYHDRAGPDRPEHRLHQVEDLVGVQAGDPAGEWIATWECNCGATFGPVRQVSEEEARQRYGAHLQ